MKKKPEENTIDFINCFETATNWVRKHNTDLPRRMNGLKLLDDAGLMEIDMKLAKSD